MTDDLPPRPAAAPATPPPASGAVPRAIPLHATPPPASGAVPRAIPLHADGDFVYDGRVQHVRNGDVFAHPTTGRCPRCPAPGVRWHRVEVTSTGPTGDSVTRTVEGDDAWVAASLRALADQLDPPKPPKPAMRPGGHREAPAASMVRRPGMVVLPPPSDVPRGPDPLSFR